MTPTTEENQFPQGLKPAFLLALNGMAKAMPFQRSGYKTSSRLAILEKLKP
jgi:hypothetical protein